MVTPAQVFHPVTLRPDKQGEMGEMGEPPLPPLPSLPLDAWGVSCVDVGEIKGVCRSGDSIAGFARH